MGRRDRDRSRARRDAQARRVTEQAAGARDEARAARRDAADRAAAATPTAGRWLTPDPAAPAVGARPLDLGRWLRGLDPRTSLQGRGGDEVRSVAARVEALVRAGGTTAAGDVLLDALVTDPTDRAALAPSFDLAALLSDEPVRDDAYDRTVRLATALLTLAAADRAGEADVAVLLAPRDDAGRPVPRHPRADQVETAVAAVTSGLVLPASVDPAVTVAPAADATGWIGASPFELFLAAGSGQLTSDGLAAGVGDTAGAALAVWLGRVREAQREGQADGWWTALTDRMPVDVEDLLDTAEGRAGGAHPAVVGGALVATIAGRHPLR